MTYEVFFTSVITSAHSLHLSAHHHHHHQPSNTTFAAKSGEAQRFLEFVFDVSSSACIPGSWSCFLPYEIALVGNVACPNREASSPSCCCKAWSCYWPSLGSAWYQHGWILQTVQRTNRANLRARDAFAGVSVGHVWSQLQIHCQVTSNIVFAHESGWIEEGGIRPKS